MEVQFVTRKKVKICNVVVRLKERGCLHQRAKAELHGRRTVSKLELDK